MSTDDHHLPELGFVEVGLQKLRTAVWRGQGSGRPLLFFNGIGANLEIAQPLAEALPDRDIVTFDLPGVGGSPGPVTPYRPWWVAHAAKTILLHYGYDRPVDVMGVSWGGAMAQHFALQHGNRVRRVILCATTAGMLMVPGNPAALGKMANPRRYIDPDFMNEHFQTLYGGIDPDATEHRKDAHIGRLTPPSPRGYFYQLLAMLGWTSLPALPFLKKEVLIMMGGDDQIVLPINGRILASLIPHSRLVEIADGGHLFLLTHEEESMHEIRRFLDAPATESELRRAA